MSYFKEVEPEGSVAIVSRNGVYQQCPLYTRNGMLFAKVGAGFVRLAANGSTSHPGTCLDTLIYDGEICQDQFGRLCEPSFPKAKPIPAQAKTLLLGAPE